MAESGGKVFGLCYKFQSYILRVGSWGGEVGLVGILEGPLPTNLAWDDPILQLPTPRVTGPLECSLCEKRV